MANFMWIDPSSDGHGFGHVSKTDRAVWDMYEENMDSLEAVYNYVLSGSKIKGITPDSTLIFMDGNYSIPDKQDIANIREGQDRVRINAMQLYRAKCAICSIDHPKLLTASHIVPWSANESIRADPSNVLLLCALHDRLFDSGLISVADDYTVIVSGTLDYYEKAKDAAMTYAGKKLYIPNGYPPKLEYLKYHRKHIFKE